jgi:soluble lytic murein transglycosylase-like protein
MGSAQQFVFPGAIFGSLVLAVFAFLVTAGVNPPVNMASQSGMELNASKAAASPLTVQKNNQASGGNIETENQGKATKEDKNLQSKCSLSKKYPEKILQWCDFITKYAKKTNLDADLIAALIWQESGGNPEAYSASGAVGLMQVMPSDGIATSFMCKNGPCFADRPTIGELQDPQFNIKYGTSMLAGLVAKYGDIKEALRYYGPGDVGYYYADKVLGIYQNYRK